MRKAYYARPLNIYGTPTEQRDMEMIKSIGFVPVDINKLSIQDAYQVGGMEVFKEMVQDADCLFFRSMLNGKVGSGVYQEIEWAQIAGIPVFEIPTGIKARKASVEETQEYLSEVGQR